MNSYIKVGEEDSTPIEALEQINSELMKFLA